MALGYLDVLIGLASGEVLVCDRWVRGELVERSLDPTRHCQMGVHSASDQVMSARITSYNVCYTKLLRELPDHGCTGRQSARIGAPQCGLQETAGRLMGGERQRIQCQVECDLAKRVGRHTNANVRRHIRTRNNFV